MRVLIVGYGKMGKNHGNTLSELGVSWDYHDPSLGHEKLDQLSQFSHVIIATPILDHYFTYRKLSNFDGKILIEKPVVVANSHLSILDDSRIVAGVVERFNPVVMSSKKLLGGFKIHKMVFTREVREVQDNLYFEIAIHDLDLLNFFFEKSNIQIRDFKINGKTEYILKLTCNSIDCEFNWRVQPTNPQRHILAEGDDLNMKINLIEQEITINNENVNVDKERPLTLELRSFLGGYSLPTKKSHQLMIDVMEGNW